MSEENSNPYSSPLDKQVGGDHYKDCIIQPTVYCQLNKLTTKKGLLALLSKAPLNIERSLRFVDYERKLKKLLQYSLLVIQILDLATLRNPNSKLF